MTVREMHIEIGQSTQLIAANKSRKLLTAEIDWVLTKIQERYIQSCLRPVQVDKRDTGRYTVDELKLDAIRNLIISGKTITAYNDNARRAKTYLPGDYKYLLSDESNLINTCGGNTLTSTTTSFPLTLLHLSQSAAASGPYYMTSNIQVNATQFLIPANLDIPNEYIGYLKKDEVTFLRDWYITKLRQSGMEVYWERYGSIYQQNFFIFPGSPSPLMLEHDGVVVTNGQALFLDLTEYTNDITDTVVNRLVDSSQVGTLLNTPFYKSSLESPISELNNNVLYTYYGENMTVKSTIISYVRKPQNISLSLGLNCELDESFHQTLCDLATNYILGRLEKGEALQISSQDLDKHVII